MSFYKTISTEAVITLKEIRANENNPAYWGKRFDQATRQEQTILRGCFKELKEAGLISYLPADNIPYSIQILKDGYLYDEHVKEFGMTSFESELAVLLQRAESIKSPINASFTSAKSISDYNQPSEDWLNDAEVFYNKYLTDHALAPRMKSILFHRTNTAFNDMVSCLRSVQNDHDFIDRMNGVEKVEVPKYQAKTLPEYDVFVSHATADKPEIVDQLVTSLNKLGVSVFYDKDTIEWGDNWKDEIINGTQNAEFAIIVISEHFFGREWTERELREFLNRQNRNGQKLILPILYNITGKDLKEKYPAVADIQAINAAEFSTDEIALMFAKQLIKRLKAFK